MLVWLCRSLWGPKKEEEDSKESPLFMESALQGNKEKVSGARGCGVKKGSMNIWNLDEGWKNTVGGENCEKARDKTKSRLVDKFGQYSHLNYSWGRLFTLLFLEGCLECIGVTGACIQFAWLVLLGFWSSWHSGGRPLLQPILSCARGSLGPWKFLSLSPWIQHGSPPEVSVDLFWVRESGLALWFLVGLGPCSGTSVFYLFCLLCSSLFPVTCPWVIWYGSLTSEVHKHEVYLIIILCIMRCSTNILWHYIEQRLSLLWEELVDVSEVSMKWVYVVLESCFPFFNGKSKLYILRFCGS